MLNANSGSGDTDRARNGGNGGNGGTGQVCFPPAVNDQYLAPQLATAVSVRLAGAPADGSSPPASSRLGPVIWVDKGDEVLVHLESIQVLIQNENVLVSVDLETDQTGRQTLVVAFSVGTGADGLLAARWGLTLQSAVWATLLNMAQQHAFERQMAPLGFTLKGNTLNFNAGAPLVAASTAQVRP
jgi:hypothetical protein